MAKARQQYFADETSIEKDSREFAIEASVLEKINSIEPGAQVNVIETVKVNGDALTPDANKAVDISVPLVDDTLYSTSSEDALSARQGRVLYDYIQNISSRGRFLSNWNCATGLAMTNPDDNPYAYRNGDYYLVSQVAQTGGTNYRPDGNQYVINQASTTTESQVVKVGDMYIYDGTLWLLIVNTEREIAVDSSLSTTSTNPVENRVVTNALNGKQDTISDLTTIRNGASAGATALQPGASLSQLTGSSDDITEGSTNLFMTTSERSKLSNQSGVNTGDETQTTIKNKLGQASTSTDGYLTSTDWNTFNNKQGAISDLETIRNNATAGKNASDTIATYGDVVTHDANEFATAAQGGKADTALQSGDNVSELTNDAGYVTASYHDSTKQDTLIAGTNIQIAADGKTISATDTTYVAGDFDIKDLADSTGLRSTWSGKQDALVAGTNIQIAADGKTISATDTKYTAGPGISISNNNVISNTQTSAERGNITGTLSDQTDLNTALGGKQDNIIAGSNIQIASDGKTISATDTTYTAGTGISIDANNVISNTQTSAEWGNITGTLADQTDLNTVLSGKQDTIIAGTNISIASDGKTISATDTTYTAGTGIDITNGAIGVDSTVAKASDLNTKTFFLTGTTGQANMDVAQAVLDWYKAGKNPIIVMSGLNSGVYYLYMDYSNNSLSFYRLVELEKSTTSSDINYYDLRIYYSGTTVSNIGIEFNRYGFLEINNDYLTPYTPQYNGSPATKKYVDDNDTIVSSSTPTGTHTEGELWYDTTNDKLKAYDGTNWNEVGPTPGIATSSSAGLVKLGSDTTQTEAAQSPSSTAGRTYPVQLNSSDQMVVNVPWSDTTTGSATSTTAGTVKLASDTTQTEAAQAVSSTANRTYGIQNNSNNQMVVNVPWTDTTYSNGTYLTLNGTTFDVDTTLIATKSDIANFAGFKVVATLPTTDIKTNIIYLLGPVGSGADKYEEYIYSNNTWVMIGDTSVDLTNYLNTSTQTSDAITQGSTNLFLTSAERTKLTNTSGTNTGDETKTTIQTKLGAASSNNDGYLTSTDWSTFNGKVSASDVLTKTNTTSFTPTGDYQPATKKYVDDGDTIIAASAPTGTEGALWYDTTNDVLMAYNGTAWKEAGTQMKVLSYGHNTWQDFLDAYNENAIVYCKASSNNDPSTGTQGRMAFMAFVTINSGGTPTSVEFQYYRSRSDHNTSANELDEVYVYKLENTSGGTWTVTKRNTAAKTVAGTGISLGWGSGNMTITNTGVTSINSQTGDITGIATSSDVNTKTFYLSGTTGATALAEAQAALDWYLSGKNPIIVLNNVVYELYSYSSTDLRFSSYTASEAKASVNSLYIYQLKFTLSSGSVTAITPLMTIECHFLQTGYNYQTPYVPEYNGSPATKKYVDDKSAVVMTASEYSQVSSPVSGKIYFIKES